MLKVARILTEGVKLAGTLTLWHGGNLDEYNESVNHKTGRWEFGPGLYLTTHWETARKYSKGSRKLYRITIQSGNDAASTQIAYEEAVKFVKETVGRAKQKEVLERLSKYSSRLSADTFINIIINNDAIKSSNSGVLRSFLVQNGVDYSIQDNAFGWNERMVVLFNMGKIIKKEVIRGSDPIDTYDLPKEFAEDPNA